MLVSSQFWHYSWCSRVAKTEISLCRESFDVPMVFQIEVIENILQRPLFFSQKSKPFFNTTLKAIATPTEPHMGNRFPCQAFLCINPSSSHSPSRKRNNRPSWERAPHVSARGTRFKVFVERQDAFSLSGAAQQQEQRAPPNETPNMLEGRKDLAFLSSPISGLGDCQSPRRCFSRESKGSRHKLNF